ncbi:unnamed protein product, partial [Brenthis ino]
MGIAIIFLLTCAASLAIEIGCYASEPKPLPEALDLASMQLLQKVYESSDDKNVVLSPLGVFTLLSLYVSNVEGQIADEIVNFLGAANHTQLTDSYRELSRELSDVNPDVLSFLNNVFIDSQHSFDYSFYLNARSYKSELEVIDVRDPKSAAQTINEWVSSKTEGKINEIVSKDDIMYNQLVSLYNVIYLKGLWGVPFDAHNTRENCFITDDLQLIEKPMMHILQSLDYYEDDEGANARMIQLPYKESKLKMVVVLPNRLDGLPMLLNWISKTGLLHYVNRMNHSESQISLHLPRFEIKSKHHLKNVLSQVGISSIFHKTVYGVINQGPVAVEKVFQEAFVSVDENGSTAGGAAGLDIELLLQLFNRRSLTPPIPFLVNRPFLFAILYDDLVLLTGTLSH